jgi:hypothetical protein
MTNEVYFPFNIYLIEKDGNSYKFGVNGGEVNSFVFNTYTADFFSSNSFISSDKDSNLANKNPYYPRNSSGKPLFDYNENLDQDPKEVEETITFTIQGSCDVYLTIPKIPASFYNFITDKSEWYYGTPPYDFINQFTIVTSVDEGFNDKYLKNTLIKGDKGEPNLLPTGFIYLNDEEFPGRIYIKIANIKIDSGGVSINYFFRSNVISPLRYFRLGNLKMRNIEIKFKTISEYPSETFIQSKETITISGTEDDPLTQANEFSEDEQVEIPNNMAKVWLPIIAAQETSSTFDSPYLFNKSIAEIKNSCKRLIEDKINFINNTYSYAAYSGRTGSASGYGTAFYKSLGVKYKKNKVKIYQIIIIYKENTNGKLIVENLFEDVKTYNALMSGVRRKNSKLFQSAGFSNSETELIEKKPMTKTEIYLELNLEETLLQREQGKADKYIKLNPDKIVELIGFAEG